MFTLDNHGLSKDASLLRRPGPAWRNGMRTFVCFIFIAILSVLAFSLGFAGCASDHGGGGDDDGSSWGEPIAGTYTVNMSVDIDDCNPDNEGQTAEWVIEIEQSKDLSVAWVRYKEIGPGKENVDLFKGDVYGTVVLKAGIVKSPIAGADCVKISVENYSVKVDLDTSTLSGRFVTDIFYMGSGCDSSTSDCHLEQSLAPVE